MRDYTTQINGDIINHYKWLSCSTPTPEDKQDIAPENWMIGR